MAITFLKSPSAPKPAPKPPEPPKVEVKPFTPSVDNYYGALSSMTKAIRLRERGESLYWLAHLCEHYPDKRYTVARRVLVSAGEDGIAGGMYELVALKFTEAMKYLKGGTLPLLEPLVCAVEGILKTPNWWSIPKYGLSLPLWSRAEKLQTLRQKLTAMPVKTLIHHMKPLSAPERHVTLVNHYFASGLSPVKYAELISPFSRPIVRQPLNIITQFPKELAKDTNFLGWAFAKSTLIPPLDEEVTKPGLYDVGSSQAYTTAKEVLDMVLGQPARDVPACFLDGMHTKAGSDKRFAGSLPRMIGMCRAFHETGALTRDTPIPDEWCSPEGLAAAYGVEMPTHVQI